MELLEQFKLLHFAANPQLIANLEGLLLANEHFLDIQWGSLRSREVATNGLLMLSEHYLIFVSGLSPLVKVWTLGSLTPISGMPFPTQPLTFGTAWNVLGETWIFESPLPISIPASKPINLAADELTIFLNQLPHSFQLFFPMYGGLQQPVTIFAEWQPVIKKCLPV